ncbi:MAG: MazG-like family protein [Chloroflexota bacterium]|nr:MazG-like family protein [Chloroflexota bacterium]
MTAIRENEWQREVAAFLRRHGLRYDPATHALDLVSEVGELAKELLLATDYGRRPAECGAPLVEEIGDVLYSLLALAEVCDVDTDEAFHTALAKLERRLADRGEAGSR